MFVIVGLGNPGKKYEKTRHNLGFMALDRLARDIGAESFRSKFKALVAEGRIDGRKVILVKPQTYMNLSGESVRLVMDFYKPDIEDLLVLYDDMDIETGKIRIRPFGSAGTHNGMKSVVQHLGTDRFPRIRIGMGEEHRGDAIDFVLGKADVAADSALGLAVETAAKACECVVREGIDIAMSRYNPKKKKNGSHDRKEADEQ